MGRVVTVARAVLLAVTLAVTLAGGQTRAAPAQTRPQPVVVVLPDCLTTPAAEVRRLLAIELGSTLVEDAEGALRVTAACKAGNVLLELRAPGSELTLARGVDLTNIAPEAQVRVLSLAIGELVAAARSELAQGPPGPGVPPPSGIIAAAPASARPRPWRLSLLAGARRFGTPGYWTLGPAFTVERSLGGAALSTDLSVEQGSATVSLGGVEVSLVSAGAAVLLRRGAGRFLVEGGAGVRGGLARLRGKPDSPTVVPDSHTAWWGGPVVTARIFGPASGRLAIVLTVEAGYAVLDTGGLVNGVREVALDGAWLAIQLGLGLRL